jgi:hypothetical protein
MKMIYQEPVLQVVKIQQQRALLQASVSNILSDELDYGGGGSIDARTRENVFWDDEW